MPRLSTATKTKRDTGILKGLPLLLEGTGRADIPGGPFTIDVLRAMIERHLRAMAKVRDLTIARRMAVHEERAVEAALKPVLDGLKGMAQGRVGKYSVRLHELGSSPRRSPS